MILCIDAGNTRLKFGLHDGKTWLVQAALVHSDTDATRDLIDQITAQLPAAPTRLLACNVAGTSMQALITALATQLGLLPEWLVSQAQACGISNGYARPSQLGHDRWTALIGARALCSDDCVVVMAGTATTIDALDASGRFRGGLILPGLTLMRQALAGATAQLPLASGSYQAWPDNTDDAIVSGSVAATAGAIERMRDQFASVRHGRPPCILSGGAAAALRAQIAAPIIWQPELVLEGLRRAATIGHH